jgi:DNA polymerase-3 subunit epsilon
MDELVVLDFETTGFSPDYARVIEVGAIIIKDDIVFDSFSQLMYPGGYIPYFITNITGITNKMVKGQPKPEEVMPKLKEFIGDRTILAHNANFDQRFLESEMKNIGVNISNKFLCTLNLARRFIPRAPNYKLTTLISHLKINIPEDYRAHRALHDVMMTFQIWLHIKNCVKNRINMTPNFDLLAKIEQRPKGKIFKLLDSYTTG